jgi:hypothetical protein
MADKIDKMYDKKRNSVTGDLKDLKDGTYDLLKRSVGLGKKKKADMRSPIKPMKQPKLPKEMKYKAGLKEIKVETKDQKAKRVLREMAAKKKSKGKKQPKGKSMAPGEYAPRKTKGKK